MGEGVEAAGAQGAAGAPGGRPNGAPGYASTGQELRPLGPLLDPASVVVVGASDRRADVIQTVRRSGVPTSLVNPRRAEVLGMPCAPSVAALPEPPEVAMVVVGASAVEAAVSEALEAGVRALVVPGLGAEAGEDGPVLARRLASLAAARGVPLLGTNCMGYARPVGASLWIGTPSQAFAPGHVSVVSQSGSIAEALVAVGPRVGYQVVVSSGAEVSRDAADLVAAFAADEGTRVVGLFLEAVRRPGAFALALRRCAEAGKPVVCLKVGRSARAAAVALTHTGAMVGSATSFSAFLRAHGVIEVDDVPELVETLEVLGRRRWPKGVRAAAISESGGEAGLLADHAEAACLDLAPLPPATAEALRSEFPNYLRPENPLDAWAVDEVDRVFPRSLQLLGEAGVYDVLIAQLDLTRFRSEHDHDWCATVVRALAETAAATGAFPAVVSTTSTDPAPALVEIAHDADIPLLRGTGAAARALVAAARWRPQHPPAAPLAEPVALGSLLRPGALPEWESSRVLTAYGVRFAPAQRATSPDQAVEAAEALGYPVAVKVDGPAHKAATGGVVLGNGDPEAVRRAAEALGGRVLVARQVPSGPEVVCGFVRDPLFGPVVSVGLGGYLAEALGPFATRLAPLAEQDALALADAVPGVDRATPAAREELVRALLGLSRLAVEHPEVEAVDINPLILGRDGAVAVDALVVAAESVPGGPPPTPVEAPPTPGEAPPTSGVATQR